MLFGELIGLSLELYLLKNEEDNLLLLLLLSRNIIVIYNTNCRMIDGMGSGEIIIAYDSFETRYSS